MKHLLYLLQASWAAGAAAAKPPAAPGTGDLKEVVGSAQPGRLWKWKTKTFFLGASPISIREILDFGIFGGKNGRKFVGG